MKVIELYNGTKILVDAASEDEPIVRKIEDIGMNELYELMKQHKMDNASETGCIGGVIVIPCKE